MNTTWRKQLILACQGTGDKFEDLITTLTEEELDIEFDNGFGGEEGLPFTAWSENFVYFPVMYDGSEWVGVVPRNPCDIKVEHMGGG